MPTVNIGNIHAGQSAAATGISCVLVQPNSVADTITSVPDGIPVMVPAATSTAVPAIGLPAASVTVTAVAPPAVAAAVKLIV